MSSAPVSSLFNLWVSYLAAIKLLKLRTILWHDWPGALQIPSYAPRRGCTPSLSQQYFDLYGWLRKCLLPSRLLRTARRDTFSIAPLPPFCFPMLPAGNVPISYSVRLSAGEIYIHSPTHRQSLCTYGLAPVTGYLISSLPQHSGVCCGQ